MAANPLLTILSALGLSLGLTAAILAGLVLRNQLSYNHFVRDYEHTYLALSVLSPPGFPADYNVLSNGHAASLARLNIPEVAATTRLLDKDATLRRGDVTATQTISWADPNLFQVLHLPTLSGNLQNALTQPDRLVLTQSAAQKFFGSGDATGRTLSVNGHQMMVAATIADLPPNTTDLQSGIFVSGLSAGSPLAALDRAPPAPGFGIDVKTYLRLKPGMDPAQVEEKMHGLLRAILPPQMQAMYAMPLLRIDRLALSEGLHPGIHARLEIGVLVGALILFIAAANFINLTLAGSLRREREVGIRKVGGAGRWHLITQFLGESGAIVLLAALIAIAASELLLPAVNAFLETGAAFDYWRDPTLAGWLILAVVLFSLAAGSYPAFILSALPPAWVLNGRFPIEGTWPVRRSLVILQFTIVTGLLISAVVVYQQRVYATGAALRVPVAGMVIVQGRCPQAFRAEVLKLPDVTGVSCSGQEFLTGAIFLPITMGGKSIATDFVSTEYSAFALYGLVPVAGKLPTAAPGTDPSRLVINETAARRFGFASPAAAIGHVVHDGMIAAVVPDFAFYSIDTAIKPTIYFNETAPRRGPGIVQIRMKDGASLETLAAIDKLWRASGNATAINRSFLAEDIQALYLNLHREIELLAMFAGLAIFLACLGLIGIAMASAERRVKEIGIRKAMGARNGEIARLLLWQFAKPVLWANLIAWPIAFWTMNQWLSGFAYHVAMPFWLFPAAGLATLLVALLTVLGQTWLVVRQKPVLALRYE